MTYLQEPPNCIKFGICEGCNLYCNFCGLQSIRSKPGGFRYMTTKTAAHVASLVAKASWNSRIEIGLFGEETANPEFVEIIRILRAALPKNYIILMSNGFGFQKDPVRLLDATLRAGVDVICLDSYDGINIVPKIREKLAVSVFNNENLGYAKFYDYPRDGVSANPHKRVRGEKRVVFTRDPSIATSGTHSYLHNYAGLGGPPSDAAAGRRCAKPFREIAIKYDGRVVQCCMDWREELVLGSLMDVSNINEIWHGDLLNAIRKKLYHGERNFGPCEGCSARSYRSGLLPDRMGKEDLPHASQSEEDLIASFVKAPIGVPVPWEQQLPERRRVK